MTTRNNRKLHLADAIMHELKTSLTAIIVSAELLAEELRPEEKSVLDRLIQSIIRNAKSIDGRISLLSEAEGLLADNSRFQPEPLYISDILHNITTQLYPEIQSRQQVLSVDIQEHIPPVRADRQYLEQVFLTIIANAIKFSGDRAEIKVHVKKEARNLIVTISDNGPGIPEKEQELVFQPYYQVNVLKSLPSEETGKRQSTLGSGQGIGLAIAKMLVELHGGKIWLESKSGQGTTFFISLPVAVPSESSSS
ncbi:MAG: HAMP domain-containing histidine kinase [Dehalococcoidales bacterium]|nr:HAMP domain-containing histidine kinase [Dehalococcoidales bacterium]